ncbi:hypothetical protein DSLASN_36290 [Desulfoluna limicola]|uniref:FG-GAP repeat protein n=1 Tax=Desulfoluna limicola TaxID=2810562 RepID=A0ABN6F8J6_9BACT|nr:VCBS repeat-containing protein [Desulfoluna limicola]BCS97997.1 hypothetical protein DSLASN_36290 [Desulfoluna limicola]
MCYMKTRVVGLLITLVFLVSGAASAGQACLSIDSISYNGPEESRYLQTGVAQMVENRLSKAGVFVLDKCDSATLAISVTLFAGTANLSAAIEQKGFHFSRAGAESELIGFVQLMADEVAGVVEEKIEPPVATPYNKDAAAKATPAVAEEALRSEVFPLRVQSVAVGDFTGDGIMEAVAVSRSALQVLAVSKKAITETSRVSIPEYMKPVRLDVLDFDGDGRQEVILSAIHAVSQTPLALVYRHNGTTLVPVGNETRFLTAVVTLSDGKRACIGQKVDGIDYWGGMFQVILGDKGLEAANPLEMNEAFKVMSWDMAPTDKGEKGLFLLSEYGRISLWKDAKTSVFRSDDNYGGSLFYLSKQEGSKKQEQRRYLVSRVQAVDTKSLKGVGVLKAENSMGSLFQGLRRYKNGRVVVVGWNGYELEPIASTPSFKGFLSDFSIVDIDGDGTEEVFCSVLSAKGGVSGKSRSYFALSSLK